MFIELWNKFMYVGKYVDSVEEMNEIEDYWVIVVYNIIVIGNL